MPGPFNAKMTETMVLLSVRSRGAGTDSWLQYGGLRAVSVLRAAGIARDIRKGYTEEVT